MLAAVRALWARVRPPAPDAAPAPAAVINMPAPHVPHDAPAAPARVLFWRGVRWEQQGEADALGRLTFVRAVSIDGRAALSEVQVLARDLYARPDGTVGLNDRE
jgi:hypothetical protein